MNSAEVAGQAAPKDQNIRQRLVSGAGWGFLGAAGSTAINLFALMFVARTLGRETYGQFVIVQSSLGLVGVFAGSGIGLTVTRYAAALRANDPARLGRIVTLTERGVVTIALLSTGVFALLSGWLAATVLNTPSLALPFTVAASAVLFSTLDGYQKNVLVGLEQMQRLAKSSLLATLVSAPLLLFLAACYGLLGAAAGIVAAAILQCAMSRMQMVAAMRSLGVVKDASGCTKEWRVLRDFTVPSFIAHVSTSPTHWLAQAILANTRNGFTEVALLGVAMQWFNAVQFVPTAAGRIILPLLTERVAAADRARVGLLVRHTTLLNVIVSLPVACGIAVASAWILESYGSEFREGWPTVSLIAMIAVLAVGATPIGQLLAASDRMWLGARMNLAWAVIYAGGAWLLAPFGALGVGAALGVAYACHTLWVSIWAKSRLSGSH